MNAPLPLFTRAEVDAEVKSATDYLAANLHEAFTWADLEDAAETLGLKESECPEGCFVEWNGKRVVRNTEKLAALLRNSPSTDEVRAACVLLLDQCAEADQQMEDAS